MKITLEKEQWQAPDKSDETAINCTEMSLENKWNFIHIYSVF